MNRFGAIFTQFNKSEIINIETSENSCFQVKRDNSTNLISMEVVDCEEKVKTFMCEYFITEKQNKTQGKFAGNEIVFYKNGYNYVYNKKTLEWNEAKTACEERGDGWSLAEISSMDTLENILEIVDRSRSFWLGARKDYSKGCQNKNNPFLWQTKSAAISSDIDYKTVPASEKKFRCCLGTTPALKGSELHAALKKIGKGKKSIERFLNNNKHFYEAFGCNKNKEFLCQQKAQENPYCLDCGHHHHCWDANIFLMDTELAIRP